MRSVMKIMNAFIRRYFHVSTLVYMQYYTLVMIGNVVLLVLKYPPNNGLFTLLVSAAVPPDYRAACFLRL